MITRAAILVFLALLIVVGVALAFDASIDRRVISSGGGHVQSGKFSMQGTIGQPVAGVTGTTNHEIQAGFWNRSIPKYETFLPSILK